MTMTMNDIKNSFRKRLFILALTCFLCVLGVTIVIERLWIPLSSTLCPRIIATFNFRDIAQTLRHTKSVRTYSNFASGDSTAPAARLCSTNP